MIDPDNDPGGAAAVFLGIYLGVVVAFGALMGQLIRVAGG